MRDALSGGAIPPVEVKCPADKFENAIREIGVGFTCEWFGHRYDSVCSKQVANVLCERSGVEKPFKIERKINL